MAYDASRQRYVLFSGGSLAADTWEWDGATWQQRFPANSPKVRSGHGLVYHPTRNRVVLYGGIGPFDVKFRDIWEWDGTNWSQASPQSGPAVGSFSMAYDPVRDSILLFGGGQFTGGLVPNTWEWNGSTWRQLFPATVPPASANHGMVLDPFRGRLVMLGGFLGPNVWEWDGTNWLQRSHLSTPPGRVVPGLVFDTRRNRCVLFGGYGAGAGPLADTWEYGPTDPAAFATFGPGCAGSAGVPSLSAALGQWPWLGGPFTLHGDRLPTNQPVLGFLGFSRTTWFGRFALPFDLTALGAPGCSVLVSGHWIDVVANQNGSAAWRLSIPAQTELAGANFYNQLFALDPGQNPLGVIVSNGSQATIGGK